MITLDRIVTSVLLRKGYPIHWYLQCLKYASDCLRELHFDVLGNVQSKKIAVNEYNAVKLPCDYVDFIKVGVPNGQYVMPLVQRSGFTRLNNYQNDGTKIKHDAPEDVITDIHWYWYDNINANGENLGRIFGHNVANQVDTFKILRERNEIQLDERLHVKEIVLEYISDGQQADSATQINPYAQACIEAYILWQIEAMNRSYSKGEAQDSERKFNDQRRILIARLNGITIEDIKRSVRKSKNVKT